MKTVHHIFRRCA